MLGEKAVLHDLWHEVGTARRLRAALASGRPRAVPRTRGGPREGGVPPGEEGRHREGRLAAPSWSLRRWRLTCRRGSAGNAPADGAAQVLPGAQRQREAGKDDGPVPRVPLLQRRSVHHLRELRNVPSLLGEAPEVHDLWRRRAGRRQLPPSGPVRDRAGGEPRCRGAAPGALASALVGALAVAHEGRPPAALLQRARHEEEAGEG
mmetsp:Transcript_81021/g.214685  ORF Transcript_81021/g.214685 Transcript_81021/m.214685 type:complete len:206 (+) Transcript_81021:1225-1842(+)